MWKAYSWFLFNVAFPLSPEKEKKKKKKKRHDKTFNGFNSKTYSNFISGSIIWQQNPKNHEKYIKQKCQWTNLMSCNLYDSFAINS